MNTFEQIECSTLVSALRAQLPQLDAVIVFGSVATQRDHADSDVDVAVFGSYADLQIRRRGLMEDIAARGTVHA